ncbi:unnamed protein product, partial [Mesorhabditis spiculigera]
MLGPLKRILALLAFRVFAVYLVRSWFVPDEYFQSTEVAHHWLFGTGHLTWEWDVGLRSALHPLLCGVALLPAKIFNFLTPSMIFNLPRILHAFIFALGDLSFLNLAERLHINHASARYAFAMYLSNWFIFYCSPRTLANSLETALLLCALRWYPFPGIHPPKVTWPYMLLGALSIMIRPTAAVFWLIFGLSHLYHSTERKSALTTAILVVPSVLAATTLLDTLYYGRLTLSVYNFLSFNVLQGGSAYFGVHPWWWYFRDGFPALLHLQLLPVIHSFFSRQQTVTRLPLYAAMLYLAVHTCLPHKEHRFLLPALPLVLLYTGAFSHCRWIRVQRLVTTVIIAVNTALIFYFALWHQVGPFAAARFVSKDAAVISGQARVITLMPCFSLPEYAYFHDRLQTFRSLDCTPPVIAHNQTSVEGWKDEADAFYEDPRTWVNINRDMVGSMTHAVMYENIYQLLEPLLWELGFNQCSRHFHAHFLTSSRQDNFIVVACNNKLL